MGGEWKEVMFSSLQRRSSLASSFVTGLVGWNGLGIVVLLALGMKVPVLQALYLLTILAVAQVVLLRSLFFPLRMDRGIPVGGLWGAVSGLGLARLAAFSHSTLFGLMKSPWLQTAGLVIGMAVGLFLSYFYQDDRGIEAEQGAATDAANYGRDAHWLEPFIFGAVSYLVVFLPRDINLGAYVFIVGAMSGVYAAGASHFSPDSWKKSGFLLLLFCIVVGGIQGAISGLLFRQYQDLLWQDHLQLGGVAGFATYLWTFLRGRQLAGRESHHD